MRSPLRYRADMCRRVLPVSLAKTRNAPRSVHNQTLKKQTSPTIGDVTERSPETSAESREAALILAKAAASGDPQARLRLVDQLLDRVRAAAYYLAGGQDCEDLVQESLVEIISSIGSFRGRSRLETWADRIAVRTIRREQKRRRSKQVWHPVDPDRVASSQPPVDHAAQGADLRRRLAAALQKLTPERRETFVLFAVHRYTAIEIAEMTETPVFTVRDRIKIARRQLQEIAARDELLCEMLNGGRHER